MPAPPPSPRGHRETPAGDIAPGETAPGDAALVRLLRRTVTDQEAERQRIARELHDTLGQFLTLLRLGLDGIGRASAGSAEVQALLARLKRLTTEAGGEVNRLAHDIRPAALDLGLEAAIRGLTAQFDASAGLRFDLHLTLGPRRLPPAIETALFRVFQEALTNIVRHAGAKQVGVILGCAGRHVTLIVEDDGVGFAAAEAGAAGNHRLGLLGMKERVTLVGGTLEIDSAPHHGTSIFARIPV